MRAVITVIGKDMVGILAKVAGCCAESNANVIEVTQSVLQDMFAMIMLVDVSNINVDFDSFCGTIEKMGEEMGLSVHIMHEKIFDSMHRI